MTKFYVFHDNTVRVNILSPWRNANMYAGSRNRVHTMLPRSKKHAYPVGALHTFRKTWSLDFQNVEG